MTNKISGLLDASQVNGFFENWFEFDEADRINAIKEIRHSGSLAFAGTKCKDSFTCPLYQFKVVKPCSLKQCQFYVEQPTERNCLVNTIESAKGNRLAPAEISLLYRTSTGEINDVADSATGKVQTAYLEDLLDRASISRFKYLSFHCVCCGMSIHDEHGLDPALTIDNQFGWCSKDCQKAVPLWRFNIEHRFMADYLDILAIALDSYRSKDKVEAILSVNGKVPWDKVSERRDHLS